MLPVLALVGRPNVGKSTLFNRLTRSRDALVADFSGLTRDRKYGEVDIDNRKFILIDTGGITGNETGIDAEMVHQSEVAIREADLVIFMVDGKALLTASDQHLAAILRKSGKAIVLTVNKIDGANTDEVASEFSRLGLGVPVAISASHGRGVQQFIDGLLNHPVLANHYDVHKEAIAESQNETAIENESEKATYDQPFADRIRLAVVGRPNVGKSTLINRMLGENRVVVFDKAGTTRDSIYIPYERGGQLFTLIDTAGVRKRGKVDKTVEKFSVIKTLQAISDAHVVLLLIDAQDGPSEQDMHLLGYIVNAGRALVIAVNKWDGLDEDDKKSIKREIERRLGFVNYADIYFISALYGSEVGNLYQPIVHAFQSATTRWSTNKLTQILENATALHQPPLIHGRRIKLRYCHLGGVNPPRLIIHGNQTGKIPVDYKRYLENTFRKILNIKGTPIKVEFQTGENPYKGKKNRLTQHQIKKRKRLVSYNKRTAKK